MCLIDTVEEFDDDLLYFFDGLCPTIIIFIYWLLDSDLTLLTLVIISSYQIFDIGHNLLGTGVL